MRRKIILGKKPREVMPWRRWILQGSLPRADHSAEAKKLMPQIFIKLPAYWKTHLCGSSLHFRFFLPFGVQINFVGCILLEKITFSRPESLQVLYTLNGLHLLPTSVLPATWETLEILLEIDPKLKRQLWSPWEGISFTQKQPV